LGFGLLCVRRRKWWRRRGTADRDRCPDTNGVARADVDGGCAEPDDPGPVAYRHRGADVDHAVDPADSSS
jgi:hypothetical protein